MSSQLFMTTSEAREVAEERTTMQHAPMGTRTSGGRYKLPLLESAGDQAPKSIKGADWVSGGVQSMTNLASSISDTKALGDWKLEQALIGVGMHPELAADLKQLIWTARAAEVDFQNLRAYPELKKALAAMAERAFDIGGANAARDAGIMAHDVWETRGQEGAPQSALFSDSFTKLDALLKRHGMERVPLLRERTVRNLKLNAAGRFDDILWHAASKRYLMADLKTKRKPFWSFLEIDAQLAGYAYAEWMLAPGPHEGELVYVQGPAHHVDLQEGVVLHMPSDGSEPRLRRANLVVGMETMRLARQVCTQRSLGRSARHLAESFWPEAS